MSCSRNTKPPSTHGSPPFARKKLSPRSITPSLKSTNGRTPASPRRQRAIEPKPRKSNMRTRCVKSSSIFSRTPLVTGCSRSSLRRRWVDHPPHLRYTVRRKPALLRVLPHRRFVRRNVDAVNLVVRHEALYPLDLRPHLTQHSTRLLRNAVQLVFAQLARSRNLALDHKLWHGVLLRKMDPPFLGTQQLRQTHRV